MSAKDDQPTASGRCGAQQGAATDDTGGRMGRRRRADRRTEEDGMGAYSTHEAIRLEEESYDPIARTAVLATGIRAYAVQFCGEYWVVWAKTASRAKGMVIKMAWDADHQFRTRFPSLRCRRWPDLDGRVEESFDYWGIPGSRDYETGVYVVTPAPWRWPDPPADKGLTWAERAHGIDGL